MISEEDGRRQKCVLSVLPAEWVVKTEHFKSWIDWCYLFDDPTVSKDGRNGRDHETPFGWLD